MSITFQKEGAAKVTLPRQLYLKIAGLQASKNLDWDDACKLAAQRIDANDEQYKQSIEKEVARRLKTEFLVQLNKGRKSIERQAYERAKRQYEIWYPCSVCGGRVPVAPNGKSHRSIIELMGKNGWGHASCHNKTS